MLHVQDGQCGLCTHFGEEHPQDQKLMQIRKAMEAAEDFIVCRPPSLAFAPRQWQWIP